MKFTSLLYYFQKLIVCGAALKTVLKIRRRAATKNTSFLGLVVLAATFTASASWGAGFQLRYQGTETMGTGFASAGSYGTSLSSIYFNPGLFLLQDKEKAVAVEALVIYPTKAEYTDANSNKVTDDFAKTTLSGGLYYGYRVNENSAFTLAITTPWGTKSDYPNDWDGKAYALETNLGTINAQPMLSHKLTDNLIFSIGPQIQYMMGTLSQLSRNPKNPTIFGETAVEGDSISAGGVLSLTYLASENTTVGFNYTSRVKHKLRGDLNFEGNQAQPETARAGVEITTPDVITLGATQRFSESLLGHLSLSYTMWSTFEDLTVTVGPNAISTVEQNWEDTYMVAAGTTFSLNENLTLRGGASYETGAVKNQYRTPRTQDSDRVALALGTSFGIGENLGIDLALNHIIYTGDITVDLPAPDPEAPSGLKGDYDTSATLFRAGIELLF